MRTQKWSRLWPVGPGGAPPSDPIGPAVSTRSMRKSPDRRWYRPISEWAFSRVQPSHYLVEVQTALDGRHPQDDVIQRLQAEHQQTSPATGNLHLLPRAG